MAERRRNYRIGERIQQLVAREVLRLSDPRFMLVTITNVMVTSDLRLAKVYFVVNGGPDRADEVLEAFEGASGTIRSVIAKELQLRFSPSLKFYFDNTLDEQARIEELLRRI